MSEYFKKILFTVIMLFIIACVVEWGSRFLLSWHDYKNQRASNMIAACNLSFEKPRKIDADIGTYFDVPSPLQLINPEYESSFQTIDLGVDSLRFRDDGIDENAEEIMLVLGDSYVEARQIEMPQTFSERLEALYEHEVDVINAGIAGTTPQQYTRVLKRFVNNHINPDIVLYCFYSGNDVTHEYGFRKWCEFYAKYNSLAGPNYFYVELIAQQAVEDEIVRNERNVKPPNLCLSFMDEWLASYRLLKRARDRFLPRHSAETLAPTLAAQQPAQDDQARRLLKSDRRFPGGRLAVKGTDGDTYSMIYFHINEIAADNIARERRDAYAMHRQSFPLLIESIGQAQAMAKDIDAEFYLVYVPCKEEVYVEALGKKYFPDDPSFCIEKLTTLNSKMRTLCDSLDINMIDITENMRQEEKQGKKLYFKNDVHFTAEGHKLWAEVVYEALSYRKDE